MREIRLIDELEYNKRYKEIGKNNGKKIYDGDSYIYDIVKLSKEVYKADELVSTNEEINVMVNDVKSSFIETFNNRGGATKQQIDFAEETAKIVFGKLKEDIVTVIPAPCGFGKSSISLEILKKLIELIKNNKTTDGLILVTDRLDSLRDTQNDLKEMDLDGYTYILEGWNENICINEKVKQAESKVCTPKNCPYFYKCKIYEQQEKQNKYPVLMITNARLKECGDSIKKYSRYENGERKVLLIDERPDILDTVKVDKKLLNEISTEISKCEYENTDEKTKFENMFKEIQDVLATKMQKLRKKYKRFIISNINNELICKTDNGFMDLWDKYMKNDYKRELEHIHAVLTKGGLYVYEKNTEFITTIGSKDLKELYSNIFKTIVFDGTALYDPLYSGMYKIKSIKYLDVENTRLYNNLYVNVYIRHKLTKTTFKDKKHLVKACGEFVNERMKIGLGNKGYVVTYQEKAVELANCIDAKYTISMLNEKQTYYFGNTKGKNDMQYCNNMFQFGWDVMPDYEYVIQWLSTSVNWDGVIKYCSDIKKAEEISDDFVIQDRSNNKYGYYTYSSEYKCFEFGAQLLNQFKMFSIVTNFYQEVHRTKLRKYTCNDKIKVNIFAIQTIILDMIKQLFIGCNLKIIEDELECFTKAKDKSFTKKDGTKTNAQKFIEWEEKFNDKKININYIKKECNFSNEDWRNVKKNKTVKNILLKYKTVREGKEYFLVRI